MAFATILACKGEDRIPLEELFHFSKKTAVRNRATKLSIELDLGRDRAEVIRGTFTAMKNESG
jgi:hypothetical protein